MFSFGRNSSKDRDSKITTLNLQTDPAHPLPQSAAPPIAPQLPKVPPEVSQEVNRRAKLLLETVPAPDCYFYLTDRNHGPKSTVTIIHQNPRHNSALLFSSPFLARFFLEKKSLPAEIIAIPVVDLPETAAQWLSMKIDSFIFNLSPIATSWNILQSDDQPISAEMLARTWAMFISIRNMQAQARLGEFYQKSANPTDPERLRKHRTALESIRNCNAWDIPFIHWKIALLSSILGDEPARQEAMRAYDSFQPSFDGRCDASSEESRKRYFEFMAAAEVGLLTEFQMLNGPDGKPLAPVMKSSTHVTPSPANPADSTGPPN